MRHKPKAVPPPRETKLKATEPIELMTFLLAKMGGMSRNSVKSLLAHRQIMVNSKITTLFNQMLQPNDLITVNSSLRLNVYDLEWFVAGGGENPGIDGGNNRPDLQPSLPLPGEP